MQNSTKQKVEGKVQQVAGQIQKTYGELTNNPQRVRDGRRNQTIGSVKENVGEARETLNEGANDFATFVQTEAQKPRTRWTAALLSAIIALAVAAYFINRSES